MTMLQACGVLSAFSGCAFMSLYRPAGGEGSRGGESGVGLEHTYSEADEGCGLQVQGNLIFLVQVISLAAFFVAEKPLLTRWTPLATLAYSYAIASVLMLLTSVVINSTPATLDLICPDCNGRGWHVPSSSILAVTYWVFLGSIGAYFLSTWGHQVNRSKR